jgi:hypothetical protein
MWLGGQLKTYKHNEGVNPNFILDGASGNDDITEYLGFHKSLGFKSSLELCLFKQSTRKR